MNLKKSEILSSKILSILKNIRVNIFGKILAHRRKRNWEN